MRRAFFLLVLAAAPLAAQTPLPADAPFYSAPSGVLLGTLKKGATARTGRTNGAGWTSVTVEGWILSSRMAARRDSLDRAITGRGSAQMRAGAAAGQSVVADMELGALLARVGERGGWTQVRRLVWVRSTSLQRGVAGAPVTAPRQPPPVSPTAKAVDASAQRAVRSTTVRAAPGGEERATLRAGTTVETLARDGGWARVRVEGWVPERDLIIADSSAEMSLSAADLRSSPAAYKGKIVRWEVQVISLQHADPLRKGLAPEEPYLLARGPGAESAILYLAIPPSLLEQARALPQLTNALVTARVRDGRSEPIGVPILDLIGITRMP